MSKPENGAEHVYFVLGKNCIRISDWNEHYIDSDLKISDIIIFDVTDGKYYNWETFLEKTEHDNNETKARNYLKRLRYKVYKPVDTLDHGSMKITKKKFKIKNLKS